MSLYHDSGVLVKLYVREESSDAVARFLAARGEAVIMEVTAKALRSRIGAICIDNRLNRPDPRATRTVAGSACME